MHPAYSVIFFTVASGAGLGLLTFLGLGPLFGAPPLGAFGWAGFVIAFALTGAGLMSSTFHLGHPERAWRALTQWRSSWLSREGVLAIVTLAVAGLYALIALFWGRADIGLGLITAALALVTVYATAMIYAQLRTVPRWSSRLTPACYLAFGLASGGLLFAALLAIVEGVGGGFALLAAALTALGWGVKLAWWREGDQAKPVSTPESATGLGGLGRVALFEPPHTGSSYLLDEMGHRIARKHRDAVRRVALALGGAVPLLLMLIAAVAPAAAGALLILAALSMLAGLFAERWLFFAEAKHVVTTYYDRRTG